MVPLLLFTTSPRVYFNPYTFSRLLVLCLRSSLDSDNGYHKSELSFNRFDSPNNLQKQIIIENGSRSISGP